MSTILVVDDVDTNREILARVLRREGYHTAYACNGAEALDAIRAEQPDLILLDLMMPEMDGVTFLRLFREDPRNRDLPVILVTALSDGNQLTEARKFGVVGCLTKGRASLSDVLSTVREHLRK